MQTTRRPLPRIPPPHLTLARPAGIRSYRPLPTPPLRSTDSSCASSTETVYLQTPPSPHVTRDSSSSLSSINSFTSASSELLFKPRPRLRISVALATFRERSSLDSLTARTPALCDPGQILPPVAHCRNSATTTDPSCPKRTPRIPKRFSRVSAAGSDDSLLAFGCPAAAIGPDVFESEKDGMSALAHIFSTPTLTHLTETCFSLQHPAAKGWYLRPYCYSTTGPITTNHNTYGSYRNRPSSHCSQGRDRYDQQLRGRGSDPTYCRLHRLDQRP